ncbi:hypothetical protein AT15_05120 [Kosmotoga arenicorallina S304]|uniref:STAS domain-containing protein n=1 Tax=Kosmotoga arenicorallina S304 TaxID=1453497 RepID=A0A176JUR7_9BACT|nr:STAS domain-containing protein [Kosmotoga arenicorallina]OAA27203.1 hypothetical protein AT15_05120 [Kosmotoga arenicorallina S304]
MVKEIVVQEKKITAFTNEKFFEELYSFVSNNDILALNMKNVDVIDSSGITRILSLRKKLQNAGSDLAIVSPSPYVKKVLLLLGINKIIKIVEDISELLVDKDEE